MDIAQLVRMLAAKPDPQDPRDGENNSFKLSSSSTFQPLHVHTCITRLAKKRNKGSKNSSLDY